MRQTAVTFGRPGVTVFCTGTKLISNDNPSGPAEPGRILNGWREIAAYFGRTQSTVKRWAAERNLPVHRVAGETARRGLPVFAYVHELAAWRRTGDSQAAEAEEDQPAAAPEQVSEPSQGSQKGTLRGVLAIALVLALAGALAASTWWPWGSEARVEAAAVPEEARELYLRGTYSWNRRTPEGIAGAIDALGRAIEIHPEYAEAHAGLAMTYNLARQYSGMSGFEAYPLAEQHARRAVELDPTLGFAQSVLAFVEFHWLWDVEAGLARFEEALRLDPNSSNTLMWYASSLLHAGRAAEALPLVNRAQEGDPHSSAVFNMKAMALFYSGQTEAATELLRELMERDPQYAWSHASMYYIQLREGDYEGYLENYAMLGELIGVERYGAAAAAGRAALAEGGVEAMANTMIDVETEYYERGEALAWDIARHHAIMGDAEGAVRWLRIGLERHEERLIGIHVDTAFDRIGGDPEFQRLVADIGLPTNA